MNKELEKLTAQAKGLLLSVTIKREVSALYENMIKKGYDDQTIAGIVSSAFVTGISSLASECPRCAGGLVEATIKDLFRATNGVIGGKIVYPEEHRHNNKESKQ